MEAGKTARTIGWIIAVILSLILLAAGAAATYTSSTSVALKKTGASPNMQVLMTKYDPFPVAPGEYADVWLKIGNEENVDIDDFTFELLEEFPFSIDPSEAALRSFGRIPANSIQTMHFKVRVSPDAVEGANRLAFRYRYVDSSTKWIPGEVTIQVQTREAILAVQSVKTSTDVLVPGKEATVTLTVKNMAQSVLRDIGVKLDLTLDSVASNPGTLVPTAVVIDSYFNALPFVPVDSVTEKRIAKLEPGETATFEYTIRTFPDAESKSYKVPLVMNFKDEVTGNYTKYDIIGLMVGAEPEVSVVLNDNTVYAKGKGTVQFRIVNKGVNDLKFLSATLEPTEAFDVMSAGQVYIGDIDSDDYETADFTIMVKKLKDRRIVLPLRIAFRDANNNEYAENHDLMLTAYSKQERGMGGISGFTKLLVLLILMGGGYYLYRVWEKKKKNKKK